MKRTLTLVLALLMMMSMAVTAFATTSPEDPWDLTPEDPAEVPGVIGGGNDGEGCTCKMISWLDREALPEAKLKTFKDAKETLEAVTPEGFSCREYFYHWITDDCDACNVTISADAAAVVAETPEEEVKACKVCTYLVAVDDVTEVAAKQYVNEEWIDVTVVVVEGDVILMAIEDAPVAVFVK